MQSTDQLSSFVSVIIPVLNDAERLEKCLEALQCQTYPKDLYEVIVVDNGSKQSIEHLINRFGQATLIYESQPGSYAARNRGILAAKGKILAFTDSDCVPSENWLETGVRHLLTWPDCGIVGGRIEIFFKNSDHPTPVELYDSISHLQQEQYIKRENYAATANLFTFREVFNKVGLFNSSLKSGGDVEWGQRASAHGYLLHYADDGCVAHPARYSLKDLYRKISRVLKGHYDLNLESDFFEDKKYISTAHTVYQSNQFLSSLPLSKTLSVVLPPFRVAYQKIMLERRLANSKQRFQVLLIELCVHYMKLFEKIRLRLKTSFSR